MTPVDTRLYRTDSFNRTEVDSVHWTALNYTRLWNLTWNRNPVAYLKQRPLPSDGTNLRTVECTLEGVP